MRQTFLTFLLALLPLVASADDSGSCGNGVTYTFVESTHTLTISGEGEMKSYSSSLYSSYSRRVPWNRYRNSIQTVIIEVGVTSIGSYSFEGCSGLTSVTIPNSVTSIGESAFYGCSSLTSISIPNSVTSIEYEAFYGCSGLTNIDIPNSVTHIGKGAFETPWYDNQPDGLIYAGKVAYIYKGEMPSNTNIVLEEGTTEIWFCAFEKCSNLTSITIPSSVTNIGDYAFAGCNGLTSIIIPNSVTSIGEWAFNGCSGLTSISIPNSVTSIGWYAFSGCNGLMSITIPSYVTIIGEHAFRDCTGLTSISIHNPVPPTCQGGAFSGVDKTIPLYVPKGSVLKYKAAEGWRDFVIIREIGQDDIYLTINDGAHGSVKLKVDEAKPYVTLKLEADNGWQVYGVTLNGENVKDEVAADGSYTTPAINANSVLSIFYAQAGTSVRSLAASKLQLSASESTLLISGTEGSEQVTVYTIDGKSIVHTKASAGQTTIPVDPAQTYIVKVDDSTFKISL